MEESKYFMLKNTSSQFYCRYRTQSDQKKDKKRDVILHRTVRQYQKLNHQLAMKLFDSKRSQRHKVSLENIKNYNLQKLNRSSRQYRQNYLDRQKRRQSLGIDEADIQNHTNKLFRKRGTLLKRKKIERIPSNKFQVNQAVKKHNIKGFTAKISHSLGRKTCISLLTKMINTELTS